MVAWHIARPSGSTYYHKANDVTRDTALAHKVLENFVNRLHHALITSTLSLNFTIMTFQQYFVEVTMILRLKVSLCFVPDVERLLWESAISWSPDVLEFFLPTCRRFLSVIGEPPNLLNLGPVHHRCLEPLDEVELNWPLVLIRALA